MSRSPSTPGARAGSNASTEPRPVRLQSLVLESRLAGLASPIEGVTVNVRDAKILAVDIDRARRFGFGGKLCIHPSQVEPVNSGFSPQPAEIEWALRVIKAVANGQGAVVVDGKLVDQPIIKQARKILARAGRGNGMSDGLNPASKSVKTAP